RSHEIVLETKGCTRGSFDRQKMERAFFNMLLNACQATNAVASRITISIIGNNDVFECRIADTGPGIPESVRATLFQPFVSAGKNNGTGLGLTIAEKIIADHNGEIRVESTSAAGTVFLIRFPMSFSSSSPSEFVGAKSAANQ